MTHLCAATCDCRKAVDSAIGELESSTRLLSTFTDWGSSELIDKYYSAVRAAQVKLSAAISAYRDHLTESPE